MREREKEGWGRRGRSRQAGRQVLWEFQASLVYTASSKTARAVYRGPVSKTPIGGEKKRIKPEATVATWSHTLSLDATIQSPHCQALAASLLIISQNARGR